jgi:hypothetical protein
MILGFIACGISSIVTAAAITYLEYDAKKQQSLMVSDVFAAAERDNTYDAWIYASNLLRREKLYAQAFEAFDRASACDQN